MCSVNINISNQFHLSSFVCFTAWRFQSSGTIRLKVVSVQTEQGSRVQSSGCVHAQKEGRINSYRLFSTDTRQNFKNLLKLRTAIALIDWTIRIHKCECFYWTQVDKIQLPCVLSCSSDSLWSGSLGEVLPCPMSGWIRLLGDRSVVTLDQWRVVHEKSMGKSQFLQTYSGRQLKFKENQRLEQQLSLS